LEVWGCVENVGGEAVDVGCVQGPPKLLAVREREGNMSQECVDTHGRLASGDLEQVRWYEFAPGETRRYSLRTGLPKSCFTQGTYDIFWAVSDQAHYPRWLASHEDPNTSLYRKRELFRPAPIVLIP
jgi:hypothetical protein